MSQKPSIGRIVQYRLTKEDAEAINKRRSDFASLGREKIKDDSWSFGAIAHVGNAVTEGESYPMVICRVWSDDCVNGQVLLDGTDTFWATSRHPQDEGDKPHVNGKWCWPPRS